MSPIFTDPYPSQRQIMKFLLDWQEHALPEDLSADKIQYIEVGYTAKDSQLTKMHFEALPSTTGGN